MSIENETKFSMSEHFVRIYNLRAFCPVKDSLNTDSARKAIFKTFRQRITGGDWSTVPAVPTARCSILRTDRTAVLTADPAVTAANTRNWAMMFSCSMRNIMTVT